MKSNQYLFPTLLLFFSLNINAFSQNENCGCTNIAACNYDPSATCDDFSCVFDDYLLNQKVIGGTLQEQANKILYTADGGVLVAGYTYSSNSGDVDFTNLGAEDSWVVKLNSNLEIEWQKQLGGNDRDRINDAIQLADGNYVLATISASGTSATKDEPTLGGFWDMWILKLDQSGNIIWQNTIGGNELDGAFEIIETGNNDLIVVGYSSSSANGDKSETTAGVMDGWILRLNSSGHIIWENTIQGNNDGRFYAGVYDDANEKIIAVGGTNSELFEDVTVAPFGDWDGWIFQLSGDGSSIDWMRRFGGTGFERFWDVIIDSDGNYLAVGETNSPQNTGNKTAISYGSDDIYVVKIDPNGNEIWQKTFGGIEPEEAYEIIEYAPGKYLLAAISTSDKNGLKAESGNGGYDHWVIAIDTDGNILHQKSIGGSNNDFCFTVDYKDGTIISAGRSNSEISGDKTEPFLGGDGDIWIVESQPFAISGCTDPNSCNYNFFANCDDGICIIPTACDSCSGQTDGSGIIIDGDQDNDGICDADDPCPESTLNPGDPCDDSDPSTENDIIQSDCSCAGTPICANPFPAVDEASLSTTFTGNSYLTGWDAVAGQIGCQVAVRFAGGNLLGQVIVPGVNASSFNIPGGVLSLNTSYEWRVRCGCSQFPLVVGPWSSWQPFTTPGGATITSSPNPTEGISNVSFQVAEEGMTTLEVYGLSGRKIAEIFSGVAHKDGDYRFEFDGSDLPNGVYLYRLTTANEVKVEKFMIAR